MSRLAVRVLPIALVLATALAGCTDAYDETVVPSPSPSESATASSGSSSSASEPVACEDVLASYDPLDPLPGPTDLPAGSTMAAIRERGRLIVGVSADSLLLGARDPISGQIQGFDIDMARLVAAAILGDPDAIELRVITAAQRIPVLVDHEVDLVARNMTITCDRWEQVAFSAEYYRSGQKVLVTLDSTATSMADLDGARVCAPASSTSLARLDEYPDVIPVAGTTHTDCLVKFQQGEVDAITGDDTVLAGLAAQDPYAKVIGDAFSDEPYGLAMAPDQVDLVSFVNAVLDQAKADGTWMASYDRWLAPALGPIDAPPPSVYGR
ncbi:glutamate ABC transporter substrate-binding protein [Actinotalea sp. M2MS4P-6]|uniref:glutamate ABC transporter substrate-binding protein n=1 Tax=Actinotalea sp. M2MS4P-6 TaxID=2983762 RepID=UPI0021E4D93C|nr:glutamate ABC transporter substrate-binding protein [Actinotalea sp. M2MS4P-6]MCV2393044.1 glutamate ABC transporter substrate-binding protein [Actinotalea sp. M2MS4P-6]